MTDLEQRLSKAEANIGILGAWCVELSLALRAARIPLHPEKPLPPLSLMGVNEIEAPKRESHKIDPTTGEAVQS